MRTFALASGFLLATLPALAQWQLQTSNTTADLRGIHSVGNGVAWASGTNGTVLRTEDGGYAWQNCPIPPGAEKLDFRGIQAFDANTAIVMSSGPGDQSRLYKTNDGCKSWKLIFSNPDKNGFWDALVVAGKVIFILGDPVGGSFVLEESHDAGESWHRAPLPASLSGEGAFAASNSSLFATDFAMGFVTGGPAGGRIFTNDLSTATTSFMTHALPMASGSATTGAYSIVAMADCCWVAVGGDYSKPEESQGTAAYTRDAGRTWHSSQAPPRGYRSSVAYDGASESWITVGPNGTDMSIDDGKNWRAVHPDAALHEPPDADRNWNAISLPYVVGPKGRIGRIDPDALKHRR